MTRHARPRYHECEYHETLGGDFLCYNCGARRSEPAPIPTRRSRPPPSESTSSPDQATPTVSDGSPLPPPTSLADARAKRDAALEKVDAAATDEWKAHADELIEHYARTHAELFPPDLWGSGLRPPPSPRALGPRILAASRAGWIRKSGRSRPSPSSNHSDKPVWDSLIYDPEASS